MNHKPPVDEGYLKYQCHWINEPSVSNQEIEQLNHWREKLYRLNLIGQYDNGIGFGNISLRDAHQPDYFIISGTQTGGIAHLTSQHYSRVTEFDWHKNFVTCVGLTPASSEALTHAAVYTANPQINAVIHVHHRQLWQKLMFQVATTNKNCAYGTPEMAEEVIKLCRSQQIQAQKIIVMAGHEEGIITFGSNLEEAGNTLLKYYR